MLHHAEAAELFIKAADLRYQERVDQALIVDQQYQRHLIKYTMLRASCNSSAFYGHNVGTPQRLKMDLHGMNSKEAITNLQDFIEKVVSMTTLFAAGFELEIVTGWGKNSGPGGPKILPSVKSYLIDKAIAFSQRDGNPGALLLKIGGDCQI